MLFECKENEVVWVDYNHGHEIKIREKGMEGRTRIIIKLGIEIIEWKEVFKIRNIIKYYWWKIKQRVFWYCSARGYKKICDRLRKGKGIWDINSTPYMGYYRKTEVID